MSRNNEKKKFAGRLSLVCNLQNIPSKGAGRLEVLAKKFGVSKVAAFKWLSGENFPKQEIILKIVKEFKINYQWLVLGVGPMFSEEKKFLSAHEQKSEIMNYQNDNDKKTL